MTQKQKAEHYWELYVLEKKKWESSAVAGEHLDAELKRVSADLEHTKEKLIRQDAKYELLKQLLLPTLIKGFNMTDEFAKRYLENL